MKLIRLALMILVYSAVLRAEEALPFKTFSWKQKPPYQVGDLLEPDWAETDLDFKELPTENTEQSLTSLIPGSAATSASDKTSTTKKDIQEKGYFLTNDGKIGLVRGGSIQLPALLIVSRSDNKPVAKSLPETIEIPLPKTGQPTKISLLGPMVFLYPFWLKLTIGLIVFVLLGVLSYLIYRKYRKSKIPKKTSAILLSEDQQFEKTLFDLEHSQFLEKGNYKKFYFNLSEAFKKWIAYHFDFDAPEMTSDEILKNLRAVLLSNQNDLEQNLKDLDWFKFTENVPEVDSSYILLKKIRAWAVNNRQKLRVTPNVK